MKILVCGIGSVGERHIRNLLSLGYEDIILYRMRNLPFRTLERSFPTFSSLDDALAEKPSVAFITNPTSLHLPVALKCAKAGCHLFIEKPLSHSLDGIDQLKRHVTERNLIVFVGYQFRFHPGLQKIKELLGKQALGRIVYVTAHWGEHLPGWHPWEDYRDGFSARQELGGGVILTLCHPFDYLRWLFGEISSVKTMGGSLSDLSLPVEDTVDVLFRFDSGPIGHVHLDYVQNPPAHYLQITGCSGLIRWDNSDGKVELYRSTDDNWEIFPVPEEFERNKMFIAELQHFIRCIKNRQKPLVCLDEGIKSLEITMAARQSLLEEKTINFQ
jgi:predicted dehydrogenase